MAMQGYKPQAEQITRTEYLCKNCGSWINKAGYVDDKHRTTRGTYCSFCNTAEKRKLQMQEQMQLEKERGLKK